MVLLRFEDWSVKMYSRLSTLMKTISMATRDSKNGSGKDELLLDVLSELTADIEDFDIEE